MVFPKERDGLPGVDYKLRRGTDLERVNSPTFAEVPKEAESSPLRKREKDLIFGKKIKFW